MRGELLNMQSDFKAWWAKQRQLQMQKQQICSIPALKDSDDRRVLDMEGKANLFAKSFQNKFCRPIAEVNEYSQME